MIAYRYMRPILSSLTSSALDFAVPRASYWAMNRPVGLVDASPIHRTKHRLIFAGLRLSLERLRQRQTGAARASFYQDFASRDFAFKVVDGALIFCTGTRPFGLINIRWRCTPNP